MKEIHLKMLSSKMSAVYLDFFILQKYLSDSLSQIHILQVPLQLFKYEHYKCLVFWLF